MFVSFEKQAQGGQVRALGGGEEAEVAYLDEALGQDVLEEAANELFGGEGAELDIDCPYNVLTILGHYTDVRILSTTVSHPHKTRT